MDENFKSRLAHGRFDWKLIGQYYIDHTYKECKAKFQFSDKTWERAIERGDIISRGKIMPLGLMLVNGRSCNTAHLKKRLIKEGILEDRCSECGQGPIWNNKPLVLQLDHKNGVKTDNRRENLRILCPHCHTQTPTYGSKSPSYLK